MPDSNCAYKGLLSLLQGMLRRMNSMSNTRSHLPQVYQVWVRKDETFISWGGVDSPSIGAISPCLGFWFLNPSAYQVWLHWLSYLIYLIFALHSVWGTTFSIPRFSLGCFEKFLQVHSRDDRESMSLLFCLNIVKPLSLRSGLLLSTCFV
jgi:hypothetical protein